VGCDLGGSADRLRGWLTPGHCLEDDVISLDAKALRSVVDGKCRTNGWSRDALASKVGVGRSTLFAWLNGSATPSAGKFAALASALGMSVKELSDSVSDVRVTSPLTSLRLSKGWSQAQLSAASGVSSLTIAQAEAGRRIRTDAAARLARALGDDSLLPTLSVQVDALGSLGQALEDERLSRGWTVAELGRNLGVSRQMASAWIHGAEAVPAGRLAQISELLKVPVAQLTVWRSAST
jgi:transcriptional regulator with XRE-family HTH domain